MNLPEPCFSSASASPATVPGTPTPSPLAVDLAGSALPCASRNIVLGRGGGRGLAVVDGDGAVLLRLVDQHEAAAAEVAGPRQRHGQREADGDRRVDGVAAAPEDVEADAAGARLLARHHAVLFDHDGDAGELPFAAELR